MSATGQALTRAVVMGGPHAEPEITNIALPAVGPHDVRVRVVAAGVCHSDLSMTNGTITPQYPVVLGHEAAGIIDSIGSAVDHLSIGEHVVLNWAPACRRCWFCQAGEPWLCSEVEGVASAPRGTLEDGTVVNAAMGVGAFAEQVVVSARSVVPILQDVPLDVAALLGCAVMTGVGAVRHTARVQRGESVLIVGLGGVGLSALMGAKSAGADPIIGVDVAADKEALARRAGATHFLLGEPKLSGQVRPLTGGRGADHAFDCVGAAETIRAAWGATRRGGQCVVVGVGHREQQVTFNPMELFHFSRSLTSSIYGASDPDRDVPIMVDQFRRGELDLAALITHRIGFDGLGEAFARMKAGAGGRSVIWLADR